MFIDLSFVSRVAIASVLGSACMLLALMLTQVAPEKPANTTEAVVAAALPSVTAQR